jgi:hypothetical protein
VLLAIVVLLPSHHSTITIAIGAWIAAKDQLIAKQQSDEVKQVIIPVSSLSCITSLHLCSFLPFQSQSIDVNE